MADKERRADEIRRFFGITDSTPLDKDKEFELRVFMASKEKQERLRTAQAMKAPTPIGRAMDGAITPSEHESPIEADLAYALSTKSMTAGRVKPQYGVGPYFVDLAFPEVKLAIECDGRRFHSDPADVARDQHRTQYLAKLGWRVLRFSGREIKQNVYGCVDAVTKLYEQLCTEQGVREPWEG